MDSSGGSATAPFCVRLSSVSINFCSNSLVILYDSGLRLPIFVFQKGVCRETVKSLSKSKFFDSVWTANRKIGIETQMLTTNLRLQNVFHLNSELAIRRSQMMSIDGKNYVRILNANREMNQR